MAFPDVLVIRLSSLGDVALTVPVYRTLKEHWPGCRVTVLTKPDFVALLEGHPCVDRVIPFRGLFDALAAIRNAGHTHLLDLHGNLRSTLLRRLAGIPKIAVYRKGALARRLFVFLGWWSPALTRHTVEKYLGALKVWGIDAKPGMLRLGDFRAAPADGAARAKKVLVVQTAFLGDAALTLPLLRALKERLPGSKVTVWARPACADMFHGNPWIDEVWSDAKAGGLFGVFKAGRRIAQGRFDLALVPHRSFRSALAVWLSGVPERIGFSSSAGAWMFTRVVPFAWGMHDLERNLSLLLPVVGGAEHSVDPQYLKASPQAAASIEQRLGSLGGPLGGPLVGLHPGSVWATKRWPVERFASLGRRLAAERGARIVLVGGSQDKDLASQVATACGPAAIDLTGATTLPELIALMPRLSLFVTNDSGPMHIATASGVPTVAIFGPTTRELGFFPYGPDNRVLEVDLDCRPCGLHGSHVCPHGHFLCMKLISVDRALEACIELIEARRSRVAA